MSDLNNGERLISGQTLTSPNGKFTLCIDNEGDLVVNDDEDDEIWVSETDVKGIAPYVLVLRDNNNLSLYDYYGTRIWCNNMTGKGHGKAYLRIKDDGNLVMYDEGETELWCTKTDETDGGSQASEEHQRTDLCLISPSGSLKVTTDDNKQFVSP